MPNIILILSVDFNILDSKALWTRVSFKTSNVGLNSFLARSSLKNIKGGF